jgi:hypothetical protein
MVAGAVVGEVEQLASAAATSAAIQGGRDGAGDSRIEIDCRLDARRLLR